jgi:hypothetical protein
MFIADGQLLLFIAVSQGQCHGDDLDRLSP